MESKNLAQEFGKISLNLRGLEFVARVMLNKKFGGNKLPKRIDEYKSGERLPKDFLTDSSSLDTVLSRVKKEYKLDIDVGRIVSIRNSLSHGRLAALVPEGVVHMFNTKYIKGNDEEVEIVFTAELDETWFKSEGGYIASVYKQLAEFCKPT